MPKLGVNIDHVATLRQARRGIEPDPIEAARICLKAGAHSIVAHLREDRRHIQDRDVYALRKTIPKKQFNLEMSIDPGVIDVALDVKPDQVTLVPERRQELTTEGGLDVIGQKGRIAKAVERFYSKKVIVSLFIAPDRRQIDASAALGVQAIELHTGVYADAKTSQARLKELKKIQAMSRYAHSLGLVVNAGHGLNYTNTQAIARIPEIVELNTGHSIISMAVSVGLSTAVRDMVRLCGGK
jgi:pyridoxine 5-phosphate synthase